MIQFLIFLFLSLAIYYSYKLTLSCWGVAVDVKEDSRLKYFTYLFLGTIYMIQVGVWVSILLRELRNLL